MEQKILFKITPKEKERIRDTAKRKGLAMASFCRFIILREITREYENKKRSKNIKEQ